MTFIPDPRSSAALAAALLHFVWEGAAIALVLSVFLAFTRSARFRHLQACVALFSLLVAFVCTWFAQTIQRTNVSMARSPLLLPAFDFAAITTTPPDAWLPPLNLDQWLSSFWIFGALGLCLFRASQWFRTQRLRSTGVCTAPDLWQGRLARLAERLKIHCKIDLLESSLIETPITMGLAIGRWSRPVILVPLGLLAGFPAGLPIDQMEAILLHELAHIRRFDYVVNLAQSAVEALFFYHPAVWWISTIIRREREHSCDDLVIAATGDAAAYARALTTLEHHRALHQTAALAASGGPLMHRIRRILDQPSKPARPITPVFNAALLLGCIAVLSWPVASQVKSEPNHSAAQVARPEPRPLTEPTGKAMPKTAPQPVLVAQAQNPPAAPNPASSPTREELHAKLVNQLESPYTKWVYEEVTWIITDEERRAFLNLQTDDERQQFIEQFWLRRDPTPGTEENELREEHYRRIARANDRFASTTTPGWMSDRGMIYIRFGPPDEMESHPNGGSYQRPAEEGGGTIQTYPFERWRYRFIEGIGADVLLEFVDKAGDGGYVLTRDPAEKRALLAAPRQQEEIAMHLSVFEQMQRVIEAASNRRARLQHLLRNQN